MDDARIIALYFARDEQAIDATAQKYGSYCAAIARNILIREDAEECVNDTWLRAWNAIPPHKPRIFSAFLAKITRNLALHRWHYNTAARRGGGETVLMLDELGSIVSDRDAEQAVDRRALIRAINEILRQLPTQKRTMFLRRYWYFDSVGTIAKRFGMTENAVSVSLSRTRAKLREELEKRGFML